MYKNSWKERNRHQVWEAAKLWRKKNPEKWLALKRRSYAKSEIQRAAATVRARNRKALLRAAKGRHNAQDIKNLFVKQQGKCFCGIKLKPLFHVDHKRPISEAVQIGREIFNCYVLPVMTARAAKP